MGLLCTVHRWRIENRKKVRNKKNRQTPDAVAVAFALLRAEIIIDEILKERFRPIKCADGG